MAAKVKVDQIETVDGSGNITINNSVTMAANQTLPAASVTGTHAAFTSTGIDDNADATAITINSAEQVTIDSTASTDTLTLNRDGGTNGWATLGFPSAKFEIDAKGAMKVAVDGTQKLYLTTAGLAFNSDTASANSLNDYEEGTWTPTIVCSTSGSYVVDTGANLLAYTKIGRVVHIQGSCGVASESSPNGNLRMSLPFTPFTGSRDTDYCMGNAILTNHGGSLPNNVNMFIYGGGDFASLFSVADDGTTQYIDHDDVDTSFAIMFSMTYIAT